MAANKTTAAFRAVERGDAAALRRALDAGVSPDAVRAGQPLLVKAAVEEPDFVAILLERGASADQADAEGETALLAAIANQAKDAVSALLKAGANPNLSKESVETPLGRAAWRRSRAMFEIAKLLVDAGADVNQIGRSMQGYPVSTPLMHAAQAGNPEVVALLLARGARVNEQVRFGTALTDAAAAGDADSVRLLLEAGADPALGVPDNPQMNFAGKTALEIAKAKRKQAVVKLLEGVTSGPAHAGTAAPSDVPRAWKELHARLRRKRPRVARAFGPPAPDADLLRLAQVVGRPLTPELRAWFAAHDGQEDVAAAPFMRGEGTDIDDDDDALEGGGVGLFRLLSAKESAASWQAWRKAAGPRGGAGGSRRGVKLSVKRGLFNPGWIPLTTNGSGDCHCLDLEPGPKGVAGQVIFVAHDESVRPQVAPSLAEWLEDLARVD